MWLPSHSQLFFSPLSALCSLELFLSSLSALSALLSSLSALSQLSLSALSQPSLSRSSCSLSSLSQPSLSCPLALSQLSLELSFSFFTKENIALFLTFYKGKQSPILDFLQSKTSPYSWLFTKENKVLFLTFYKAKHQTQIFRCGVSTNTLEFNDSNQVCFVIEEHALLDSLDIYIFFSHFSIKS